MQVKDIRASRTLVKVVHVLGHNVHLEAGFEAGQGEVSFVGTSGDDLTPALVVEFQDKLGVGLKSFR